MVEIREALTQASQSLQRENVDSPRLDAEVLLAHVLDTNRAKVLAWPDRQLTPKQLTQYRNLINRRARREPLAYILGHREFYGLDLVVDPRVLVPRPETEVLVEEALRMAHQFKEPLRIADVGAGSGAIAVALATHLPEAVVYALDASPGALEITAANAQRHGVSHRVHCLQGHLLAPLPESVHLITANLPYVAAGEWEALAPEIREYEPRDALVGGEDGLELIRDLLATAAPHLKPGGGILLEIGASQGTQAMAAASGHFPGAQLALRQDYAGLDRVLVVKT
ncbi:MAG: peptide chain release factor N(5)-glutamine methyltransferase [Anaerolineae bacterium]|jgi:release factor glutamine methyltransferase